jgi:hypothetical protein
MPEKNNAPRRLPRKEGMFSQMKQLTIMSVVSPAVLLLFSALSWAIIIGLQRLTDHWLIPHDPGTYIHVNSIANLGLLDFPTDYMAFGAFLYNFPIGLIAIAWYLFLFSLCSNGWDAWHKLPKRDKAMRKQRQVALARNYCKYFLTGTAACFVLCFPFIRRYEILTAHALLVKETFDWNEQVHPLDRLTEIHRSVVSGKGGGVIFWDFNFNDGTYFTMDGGPSRQALTVLLRLPHVSANVRIVDGRLEKVPGR